MAIKHPTHRTRGGHAPPPRSRGFANARPRGPSDDARLERAENQSSFALFAAIIAAVGVLVTAVIVFAVNLAGDDPEPVTRGASAAPAAAQSAVDISAAAGQGIEFEPYRRPDPTLPAVPPGAVKRFEVDVYEHVTKVSDDLAPTRVWSYAVNGRAHRGSGVSEPLVVEQGDEVEIKLVNGGSKAMNVTFPHSIDFHSSEVNPGEAFKTIAPGRTHTFRFRADHAGVFMYHCATQPVLMHTGAGMVGAMIVKPRNLAPVDRELWLTQQEYYLGRPGKDADPEKMKAKRPDVIAFNGYANQYQKHPIAVKRNERIRMFVLNAGPSIWSAFHVIGTVFDRTVVEGQPGRDAQTINLAPSQGGWVEFTLDREGSYPFVTHAFGDMVTGALGVLATEQAPAAAGSGHDHGAKPSAPARMVAGNVAVELGDMYVKPAGTTIKAGRTTFAVRNAGRMPHALAVELTPVKGDGDGSAALAKTEMLAPGERAEVAADLRPGSYELYCWVPGHYAAGQKVAVNVE